MAGYVCVGSVCGWCGVVHKTREAAERHKEKANRALRGPGQRDSYIDWMVFEAESLPQTLDGTYYLPQGR